MSTQSDFILQRKRREDLAPSVRMYGESEPPEMQLENMWEVVSRSTGAKLQMNQSDFSEFSSSDRMYPSMMAPDVKRRWDMKNREWEDQKKRYRLIERMARAQFVLDNPDLKLAQDLAKTSYGKDLLSEGMRSDAVCPAADEGAKDPYAAMATARDGDGRIVEKRLSLGDNYHHVQYKYDAGGRLKRVFNEGNVIEYYEYGEFGERIYAETLASGRRQYKYDEDLRLIQAGEVKYLYDAKGRLALKQDNGLVTRYSYLPSGVLHTVLLPDGKKIEYHLNSKGMRIAKSVNGKIVEKYSWKDFTTLEAVVDGAGQNLKEFAYDNEGDPVAMVYNDEMYYFASDQVGSTYLVADADRNKVGQIIYDSFGNLICDTDGEIDISLGFAAGLLDRDTGLIHFGYREYDPEVGRFTTPDPIGLAGGDVDVYGYCWDDPINFVDRAGLKGKSEEELDGVKPPKKLNSDKAPLGETDAEHEKKRVLVSERQEKKKKPGLTLNDFIRAGLEGAAEGAGAGFSLAGPSGAVTGAFVGAPVNMLYKVGKRAVSDIFGVSEDTQDVLFEAGKKLHKKGK